MNELTDKTGPIGIFILLALFLLLKYLVTPLLRGEFKKNGRIEHRTFADEPDVYWRNMRDVVTAPLSEVLREQSTAMRELMKEMAEMKGEQRGRLKS